jgi:hypothetical protein
MKRRKNQYGKERMIENKSLQESKKNFSWANLFSLVALLVSLFTAYLTCNEQKKQNKRWNELNVGKIGISAVKFYSYRQINLNDFKSKNWGYDVHVISESSNGVLDTGSLVVQNIIIGYNKKTKEYIEDLTIITVPEMISKLQKLPNYDSSNFQILKKYKVLVYFKNSGTTDCKITGENFFVKNKGLDTSWINTVLPEEQQGGYKIKAGETKMSFFHLVFPMELDILPLSEFKGNINFQDEYGTSYSKNYSFYYDEYGWRIREIE